MALNEKGIATVQGWIEDLGVRGAAKKMIDSALRKTIGLTSEDLSDTTTFANGLDEIESLLDQEEIKTAWELAKETASEMLEDEGYPGMFESKKKKNKITIKESQLKKIIKEALDGVLYPRGGSIGGEHQKKMTDDEIYQNKFGPRDQNPTAYDIALDKFYGRVKNYFGTSDLDNTLYHFFEDFDRNIRYFKSSQDNWNRDSITNALKQYQVIIEAISKYYNIDLFDEKNLDYFINELYPQMKLEYKQFCQERNTTTQR